MAKIFARVFSYLGFVPKEELSAARRAAERSSSAAKAAEDTLARLGESVLAQAGEVVSTIVNCDYGSYFSSSSVRTPQGVLTREVSCVGASEAPTTRFFFSFIDS